MGIPAARRVSPQARGRELAREGKQLWQELRSVKRAAAELMNRHRDIPSIQAHRYAAGLSQDQAAVRYNEAAEHQTSLGGTTINAWETWARGRGTGSPPPFSSLLVLSIAYGRGPLGVMEEDISPGDLVSEAYERLAPEDQISLKSFGVSRQKSQHTESTKPHFSTVVRDDPSDTIIGRDFSISVPTVNNGPGNSLLLGDTVNERMVLGMAAKRARRFATVAGQDNAPTEVIEQLQDDVHRLAVAYPQQPLHQILGDLVEQQDVLFTLLEQRQRPQHARQLYFLGSVICGLLAKASHDLADPHAAMAQARTAYLCADNADHNGLRGWLRGLQSFVAYWAGRPQESIRYARQGAEYAALAGTTTAVWLPANEARAWAALGNPDRARDAIQRAQDAWDHVQPDDLDELGGICTFNRSRTLYYAADAFAWLPAEAEEAQRYSLQAIDAYADPSGPDWAFGDQAGSYSDLAIARIGRRELEGAREALNPVLALPPAQRINGIIHSAQRVSQAIVKAGLAEDGQDLLEEIEIFTRTPIAALPK